MLKKVVEEGATALGEIIRDFTQWVLTKCDPKRLSGDKELELETLEEKENRVDHYAVSDNKLALGPRTTSR